MKKINFNIENIPAIEWGEKSNHVFIAVHGNMSNKNDTVIQILADVATKKGFQVLSFDLPQHGDRKEQSTLCKVQICVKELDLIIKYAKSKWSKISIFACSIGTYFSLLAYKNENLIQSLFLSPVVDMKRIIINMMTAFNITNEELKDKQEIKTPIGETLYWDYLCYVNKNPIDYWNCSTAILYGANDTICEYDSIIEFTNKFKCNIEIVENGEHFFHTDKQLNIFKNWLDKHINY